MKSIDHNFDISKELGLEDLPNEIWKDIQGYEGLYQVSNLGRVKSLKRTTQIKDRILKISLDTKGYFQVKLCRNGIYKGFRVHRLVANAFITNPENKPEIDHINGVRTDNFISNLRWVTSSENKLNPITYQKKCGENCYLYGKKLSAETKAKMSAKRKGKDNPRARKVINLDTNVIFDTIKSASEFYGLTKEAVSHALKSHNKCAGFYWGYYSE